MSRICWPNAAFFVSYETIRQWCGKFGPEYARRLKRRQGRLGDTWFLDEVFVTIIGQRQEPMHLVTDQLGSYRVAHRDIMPLVTHDTAQYANNRAEVSPQPTHHRERQMRGFTSAAHAQRFLREAQVLASLNHPGIAAIYGLEQADDTKAERLNAQVVRFGRAIGRMPPPARPSARRVVTEWR